jgi:hypothetical protein
MAMYLVPSAFTASSNPLQLVIMLEFFKENVHVYPIYKYNQHLVTLMLLIYWDEAFNFNIVIDLITPNGVL